MILVIIVLYVLATILLGELWTYTHHAFIDEAQNYFTVFMELNGFSSTENHAALVAGITSCISTFIADFSLVSNKKTLLYKIANHILNHIYQIWRCGLYGAVDGLLLSFQYSVSF